MHANDLKQIDISELTLGMFVVKVITASSTLRVKTEGLVRTPTTLQNLKNSGALKVWIDPDRSEETDEPVSPPAHTTPTQQEPAKNFEEKVQAAMSLYEDAKCIQKKMIANIKKGKAVNLQEADALSSQIIESVFSDPNSLMMMCQMKDKGEYIYQHALNCAILMSVFARYLDFDESVIEKLATGALLHDVGNMHIEQSLIDHRGQYSPAEFEQMKHHVDYSVEVASSMPGISQESLDVIRLHHERLDGSGYPNGLSGDDINIYGRMIALIDSYNALTSDRLHKDAVAPFTAFKIMTNGTPNAYDNDLMKQLIRCIGVFPVGSLVKLSSNKLAMVVENNFEQPLKPKVVAFYSITGGYHTEIKHIDLAASHNSDQIETSVRPDEFKLDLMKFMRTSLR
ncbi:HD-GYP domain-containing protein [Neiella marina]|uniref:HD-GYP domain-containing protein n=1 Tax=Neiella holothuriorum TaxID=2870530 RepID=A0ABS7EFI4_9GAMM|nr:HD-GYP domain-containing protein [Neiella holothuriorum]MBW8191121.1 HD-GYP domain-containing protein [Neiella holothuriorum]